MCKSFVPVRSPVKPLPRPSGWTPQVQHIMRTNPRRFWRSPLLRRVSPNARIDLNLHWEFFRQIMEGPDESGAGPSGLQGSTSSTPPLSSSEKPMTPDSQAQPGPSRAEE